MIRTPVKVKDGSIIDADGQIVALAMGYDIEKQEYTKEVTDGQARHIVMALNTPPDDKIRTQRNKLMLYAQHDQKCLRRPYCSCGLDALLDEIGGKP